jgi:hypothetical protein
VDVVKFLFICATRVLIGGTVVVVVVVLVEVDVEVDVEVEVEVNVEDVDVEVEVDEEGISPVVVVLVVMIGLQHSYASISFQSPTLGISLCKIRLPGINLPVPSYLTNAFKSFRLDIVINLAR